MFFLANYDKRNYVVRNIFMRAFFRKILPEPVLRAYAAVKRFIRKKILHSAPEAERVEFDCDTVYKGHFGVTYRGIPCLKCPFDYVHYQMILDALKPDLVIEIGTNIGGGALYLADLMNIIGRGTVHTIDIADRADKLLRDHPRIKLFTRGWEKYDVRNAAGFRKVLVIEDSSHTYENTLGTLRKFGPLVTPGSYFIVEDGIINEQDREEDYQGGPLRAIREYLAADDSYVVDRAYCDWFGKNATANVNGYLKKVK